MSVEPVETEFGRKTRIHQSSCNKDYSCVKGFCPSFLTITPNPEPAAADGAKKKKKDASGARARAARAAVQVDASFGFGIHVMGIGGTGSVTVVATLANAARLEGKHVIGLDQTAWRKGRRGDLGHQDHQRPFDGSNKISDGRTDLYLGFDILNATDPKNLDKCHPERTIAVVSTTQTPTGKMVTDRHILFPRPAGSPPASTRSRARPTTSSSMARRWPKGCSATPWRPTTSWSGWLSGRHHSAQGRVDRGRHPQQRVAVDMSLAAFRWGRMAVADRAFVDAEIARNAVSASEAAAHPQLSAAARAIVDTVGVKGETKRLLEVRVPDLIDYQDEAYARRYAEVVKRVVAAEAKAVPGQSGLAEAARVTCTS